MRIIIALALVVSATMAQARTVNVTLAAASNKSASLVCNGKVVLEAVRDLRLAVTDGTIVVAYRPKHSISLEEHVLIIQDFGICQAHEE